MQNRFAGPVANAAARLFGHLAKSRFRRDQRGIAAVEFALLLPLMLMIYLGLVELSRGMRAAQKMDMVSHILADLTAQILPNDVHKPTCTASGPACIFDAEIDSIFAAAPVLMSGINDPAVATKLKMTISEVNIVGAPVTAPTSWTAQTSWSVSRNGATKRPCQVLAAAANPPPLSYDKIPQNYVQKVGGVEPSVGPIIVVDISYDYSPGVNFEMFKWKSPPTWTLKRTAYAAVRNTFMPSHINYYMTTGTNCNAPTP